MEKLRWIYRAWRYRLKLEKQEITTLLSLLGPGDIAVDIGAHKGAYTYWMLKQVGEAGKIFAFEPQPQLHQALTRLIPQTKHKNVRIENMGLSSSSGVLNLNLPSAKPSPSASFEQNPEGQSPLQSYPVDVSTLDEYFQRQHGGRINLIKCDAEGHELEVFRGGENLLRQQRPYLLFECEARHRREGDVQEVFAWLEELGYHGQFIAEDGLHDIADFDASIHQASASDSGYVNNFLFSWPEAPSGNSN
jgi:FkbM family methyltransferase